MPLLPRLAGRRAPRESCYAADHIAPGPAADPRVFATPLAAGPAWKAEVLGETLRHCTACDVKWHGGVRCWCCGQAVAA